MARVDLERKVESLEEEIQFLRKIHEEVRPGRGREGPYEKLQVIDRQRCSQRETEKPNVRKKTKTRERVKTETREMCPVFTAPENARRPSAAMF